MLFLPLMVCASEHEIVAVRTQYYKAADDKDEARQFLIDMETVNKKSDPLLLGYKAMAHMLQAKHSWNPYHKIDQFNSGKELLELAIANRPENSELRFLRFCIQSNAPFFLGYADKLEEDKKLILSQWFALKDVDLRKRIADYMRSSDACSAAEKKQFTLSSPL